MNFADFQCLREKLLRERGDVLDCAESNLYRALARLVPPPSPVPTEIMHRCHLASEWAACFGFPTETSRRAFVSCGVRDSLTILFRHYAGRATTVWLPADNYPVYGELARATSPTIREFPTLPEPQWPEAAPAPGLELLVVTNPLKPLGRWLTGSDVTALETWLARSPRRRLVLDAVYTFATEFHPTTLQLLATQQTILLHSLTKGWLHPRLFGVTLVPESDVAALSPAFRAQAPSQPNLARARELLACHAAMPAVVARELAVAHERMVVALPACLLAPAPDAAPGYFSVVSMGWEQLLEDHDILGMPAAVFGSTRQDLTILSSLRFLP